MIDVQARYNEVEKFNDIAGNLGYVDAVGICQQVKLVQEEVGELEAACEDGDAVELLDGVCDAFVTLAGLMQQMERAGFKVDEALKRVNENNLSKFVPSLSDDEIQHYDDEYAYYATYNEKHGVYVLKDFNDKVRKPIGFVPVQIADLAPDLFERGFPDGDEA
jgi:hypothetical protein